MKKFFLLFFIFLFQVFSAQTHRFTYEYRFTLDSTKIDTLHSEYMNLDIGKNETVYYGQARFLNDSININSIIHQQKTTPGSTTITDNMKPWNTAYIIKKNRIAGNSAWETLIGQTSLLVEETPKQDWKILQEREIIENYNCQKAVCDFGGRKWTAWFSTDVPIPEGPYKFHGLPGIIVKLEDATKTHNFLLKGNKKLATTDKDWSYIEMLNKEAYGNEIKPISVNQKQFKKLWKDYVNDPVKDLKQELSRPGFSMEIRTADGRIIKDNAEIIKIQEEKAKNRLKKRNNPIELDLYEN